MKNTDFEKKNAQEIAFYRKMPKAVTLVVFCQQNGSWLKTNIPWTL